LCSGPCATPGKVEGNGICGVAVPSGFNECIGARRPFGKCIEGGSKQLRRACSVTQPCGPDYVCAAATNAPAGIGACMPTYFMFRLRVDGPVVGELLLLLAPDVHAAFVADRVAFVTERAAGRAAPLHLALGTAGDRPIAVGDHLLTRDGAPARRLV